jgi:hypothetical protein
MGKITLTFVLFMALNLNLISSIKETIEQKKFALILPANFSKYRHELTNEMKIKPKIPPWQKIHYEKDYNYCVHFKVLKNIECLLNYNLTKKEVYVLCERPAINEFGNCNGDGFYGLNTYFLNLQNNCLGEWKKLNKTSNCIGDFIFV